MATASHLQSQKCCTWGSFSQRKPQPSPSHLRGLLSCGEMSLPPPLLAPALYPGRLESLDCHQVALDMAAYLGNHGRCIEVAEVELLVVAVVFAGMMVIMEMVEVSVIMGVVTVMEVGRP